MNKEVIKQKLNAAVDHVFEVKEQHVDPLKEEFRKEQSKATASKKTAATFIRKSTALTHDLTRRIHEKAKQKEMEIHSRDDIRLDMDVLYYAVQDREMDRITGAATDEIKKMSDVFNRLNRLMMNDGASIFIKTRIVDMFHTVVDHFMEDGFKTEDVMTKDSVVICETEDVIARKMSALIYQMETTDAEAADYRELMMLLAQFVYLETGISLEEIVESLKERQG